MRKALLVLAALFALIVLSKPLAAQTTYTQEAPVLCTVATLQCHNIALTPTGSGNEYTIGGAYSTLYVGARFNLTIDGTVHNGSITVVNTQFPAVGTSGAFGFSWSTQDGLSGTVSGQGHWTRLGKWWYAEIDSSTVTVQ